jgi:hypothetical protein
MIIPSIVKKVAMGIRFPHMQPKVGGHGRTTAGAVIGSGKTKLPKRGRKKEQIMKKTRRMTIGGLAAAIVLALGVGSAQAALISHWTFDSDMNDSAGSNHGTAFNGAAAGAPGIIGGGALALNGVNQYVNVGSDSTLNITGLITISMWVNLNNTPDNMGFYTRGEWNHGHSLLTHGGGNPPLWTNNNIEGGKLFTGTWYQIAKTYDGTTARLYIDGKEVVSGTFDTGAVSTSAATWIGGESQHNRYFVDGFIDDVGVYSTAFTATDLALVNGLGRTGGIGLDQLSAAQALWSGGGTATIGGATWQKVTGLSGSLGDYSGTVADLDATIVLDGSGGGLQVIPEPASLGMLGAAAVAMLLRRRFRR